MGLLWLGFWCGGRLGRGALLRLLSGSRLLTGGRFRRGTLLRLLTRRSFGAGTLLGLLGLLTGSDIRRGRSGRYRMCRWLAYRGRRTSARQRGRWTGARRLLGRRRWR